MSWIEIWAMIQVIGGSFAIFLVVTFLIIIWVGNKYGK
jgi:hypothetical protein